MKALSNFTVVFVAIATIVAVSLITASQIPPPKLSSKFHQIKNTDKRACNIAIGDVVRIYLNVSNFYSSCIHYCQNTRETTSVCVSNLELFVRDFRVPLLNGIRASEAACASTTPKTTSQGSLSTCVSALKNLDFNTTLVASEAQNDVVFPCKEATGPNTACDKAMSKLSHKFSDYANQLLSVEKVCGYGMNY